LGDSEGAVWREVSCDGEVRGMRDVFG
jgi:hypothetical protein